VTDADERARQREVVRSGYNRISRRYRHDTGAAAMEGDETVGNYARWIADLAQLVPAGARVLDLGCGAGVPAAKLLVEAGFDVTGVDLSEVQIERARSLVPGATFVQADMATWDAEASSFDAIVSLYALIHVPLQDQRDLFPRLARWLRPAGYLLAIVGHEQWTGVEEYLGAPMFWDHADAATYVEWLEAAGLVVHWHRFIPEGTSGHTLVLARRPQAPV
jgi:cyclopropane fatty-acyl-phospholipid synthase-like methyltransferase